MNVVTIGNIRLIEVASLSTLLRSMGNPDGLEWVFLNVLGIPILRLPSGDYIDESVLDLCLSTALSPWAPNIVVPPAVPPNQPIMPWRIQLTPREHSKHLVLALGRLLARKPPANPERMRLALGRACRRFVYAADGLRPLMFQRMDDEAIFAHLQRAFSADAPPFTTGDPLTTGPGGTVTPNSGGMGSLLPKNRRPRMKP